MDLTAVSPFEGGHGSLAVIARGEAPKQSGSLGLAGARPGVQRFPRALQTTPVVSPFNYVVLQLTLVALYLL